MASRTLIKSIVKAAAMAALMFTAAPAGAQKSEWFCHGCGYRKPVDGVLFFDDMQSGDPLENWSVAELKDFENSGLGIDGTLKVEFDMYLFSPASGPRKDDSEDWCFVNFCDQEFMPGPTRSIFLTLSMRHPFDVSQSSVSIR